MRDIVAEENRRDELAETRALGLLQTSGVGVTLVAGLLTYLTSSTVAGASLLIPILAVASLLLIKAMYRGLMTVRPRNHGRPSVQLTSAVQTGEVNAALKRYIAELRQILEYNKERTNTKLYHYHCCLVNVAVFMLFALIFGAAVITIVLLKPALDATTCYVCGAVLLTLSAFIDYLVVHNSNVWDFIRDQK